MSNKIRETEKQGYNRTCLSRVLMISQLFMRIKKRRNSLNLKLRHSHAANLAHVHCWTGVGGNSGVQKGGRACCTPHTLQCLLSPSWCLSVLWRRGGGVGEAVGKDAERLTNSSV